MGAGSGLGAGSGVGSGAPGIARRTLFVTYEASRTSTRRATSAPVGVHGKIAEASGARSPLSVIAVQSRTSVSVPSAPTCTARTCDVPAMPPVTDAVTSTGVPAGPFSVYPAPASAMPVPDSVTDGAA